MYQPVNQYHVSHLYFAQKRIKMLNHKQHLFIGKAYSLKVWSQKILETPNYITINNHNDIFIMIWRIPKITGSHRGDNSDDVNGVRKWEETKFPGFPLWTVLRASKERGRFCQKAWQETVGAFVHWRQTRAVVKRRCLHDQCWEIFELANKTSSNIEGFITGLIIFIFECISQKGWAHGRQQRIKTRTFWLCCTNQKRVSLLHNFSCETIKFCINCKVNIWIASTILWTDDMEIV